MQPLSHKSLTAHNAFTVTSVHCAPGTLYLGITLTGQNGDRLHIELNNYWQILTPNQPYPWENNGKYQTMDIPLLGKKLIEIQGYTNFYNNKFFLEDSMFVLNIEAYSKVGTHPTPTN